MPTLVTRFSVLLVLGLSAISCGGQSVPASASKDSRKVQSSSTAEALAGYEQVMSSLTIDGQALAKDDRAVAMVFFASWCGHCRTELGQLDRLRKRHPQLRIIGLNAYEEFQEISDQEKLRSYIAENAPWLTEVVTANEAMRATFGKVPRIPSLFLYNNKGEVVAEFRRDKGPPATEDELDQAIARAVAN